MPDPSQHANVNVANQAEPPTIRLIWNAEQQSVDIGFNAAEFKNWDFIIAVLDMAKRNAEEQVRQNRLALMQQQALAAQQQRQGNELARRLLQKH